MHLKLDLFIIVMRRYDMKNIKPNWDDIEAKWWVEWVENKMEHGAERSRYLQQIREAEEANEHLRKSCVFNARINPSQDEFRIKPGKAFFKAHPMCFGYGQWTQSENSFESSEGAKDAILTLNLPNIDAIDLGWLGSQPRRVVERCNDLWHDIVGREVREGILVDEGLIEGCSRDAATRVMSTTI